MNLRNFHSFRRMTRRSSTCRSALLMVLPKRRNNLHISTWPGVLSVISVHQRLSMARMLMAGAGSGAAGSGRSGLRFHGRLRSGLGRSGLRFHGRLRSGLGRSGLGRIHAELPHPAQALVEPVRAGLCAFHQLVSVRALRRGEFPPEPIPGPLHLLKGGASRQCVSRAHGGEQALACLALGESRHRRAYASRANSDLFKPYRHQPARRENALRA